MFDRAIQALLGLVRGELGLDYLALYPARVVSQHADGSVDLAPDDTRVPHHNAVPMDYGLPGTTATFVPGARVLLGWRGGDPGQPYAQSFAPGSESTQINIGGTDTAVARADLTNTNLTNIATALSALGHPVSLTPVGSSTVFMSE